jgi:subtilisin
MRRGPTLLCLLLVSGVAVTPAMAQHLIPPGGAAGPPSRSPEIIPDRYIVELHSGASIDGVVRGHGLATRARFGVINGFVAHMSHAAATALSRDHRVRRVSPDLVVRAYGKPADPPGKKKNSPGTGGGGAPSCPTPLPVTAEQVPIGVARIGAPDAWSSTITRSEVKVAVIDTGIDFCHPDLAANYVGGINYIDSSQPPRDDNGHGTHVSGIIAAAKNDTGIVGVAPKAKLLVAKVLDATGSGSLSSIVTALDWAVQNGARVVNLSLGAADFWCTFGLCGAGPECTAISNAVAHGVVVVVAAGNSADEALFYTPANCQDSLTVTALDASTDQFAPFSNHSVYYWDIDGNGAFDLNDHPVVDISAPGVNVLSTMPTYDVTLTTVYGIAKNYGVLSGTSMATPHVAGAAALYLSGHPAATADQVRQALVASGECAGTTVPAGGVVCGSGWLFDHDGVWEPLVDTSGL